MPKLTVQNTAHCSTMFLQGFWRNQNTALYVLHPEIWARPYTIYISDSEGLRIASRFWFGGLWYKGLGKPLFSLGCSEKQAMNAFTAITWTIRGVTSALDHSDVRTMCPRPLSPRVKLLGRSLSWRYVPFTKRPLDVASLTDMSRLWRWVIS